MSSILYKYLPVSDFAVINFIDKKWSNSSTKVFLLYCANITLILLNLSAGRLQERNRVAILFKATWSVVIMLLAVQLLFTNSAYAQIGDSPQTSNTKFAGTWVEEWNPEKSCWIKISNSLQECSNETIRPQPEEIVYTLPQYGPFLMLNSRVAVLMGPTNSQSLDHFTAMIADFPTLRQINLINASGTTNDIANLKVGRMIRASGLVTHVPAHGSVRSGAVEIFLAGVKRTMEKGALFAVHQWHDQLGRGPNDFEEHHPVNQLYLNYYMDMGMGYDKARAFYNMTNSVPHSKALWFGSEEMELWLKP